MKNYKPKTPRDTQLTAKGLRPPISSYSVYRAFFVSLIHRHSRKALFGYLKTVASVFFILQFSVKWRLSKREIVYVDHPLDESVPFAPAKVGVYLDFVAFWIRPLTMMHKTIGKRSVPHIMRYLDLIDMTYRTAGDFYRFRLTTTKRPTHYVNRQFSFIRAMDPHYLCVPSLHIAIVLLTFSYFKKAFAAENYTPQEQEAFNKELYEGAVSIAETVLYVKQHSVNCIPAALFMMTDLIPDLFTLSDAIQFIDDLFIHSDDIQHENKLKLKEHIHHLFEVLVLQKAGEDSWQVPLQRWILRYKSDRPGIFAQYGMELPENSLVKHTR